MKYLFKLAFIWISLFIVSFAVFRAVPDKNISDKVLLDKEIADILDRCDFPDSNNTNNCFRKNIKELVITNSAAEAIASLQKIYSNHPTDEFTDRIECHSFGHIIGEIDGENSKNVGESLSKCTTDCGNACYHGILIGAIKTNPQLLDNLPSVCQSFTAYSFPGQQMTACNHGLGHGLAEFSANDTKQSLSYCDRLINETAKVECGSGVFMETIDDAVKNSPENSLPIDISAFCKELNHPYLELCTRNIGNYRYRTTHDIPAAFKACENLDSKNSDPCFNSLGADFFFIFLGKTDDILKVCQNAPKTKIDTCLEGSIISSLVTDPKGNLGVEICNLSQTFKDKCLTLLSSHLAKLQGEKYRQEFCERFVYNNKETCLSVK